MGDTTKIEWTDHTFNPWWGCTKVSAGCDHCYAETFDKRIGGAHWGPHAPRRTMSEAYWKAPLRWDKAAAKAGKRARVFCASMADVFDAEAPADIRIRLWALIRSTPRLDWLMLTKRPQLIKRFLPADWGDGYPNVWLGTSVEDQRNADTRIPYLLNVPAAVRFLSLEPLLGPVDLLATATFKCNKPGALDDLHWAIIGGESGAGARPMDLAWARGLLRQCRSTGIAPFVKQLGADPYFRQGEFSGLSDLTLRDRKGGNWAEWPEDLRVREWPKTAYQHEGEPRG